MDQVLAVALHERPVPGPRLPVKPLEERAVEQPTVVPPPPQA